MSHFTSKRGPYHRLVPPHDPDRRWQTTLGCVLKVFTFHAEQFSAINRASKEAHLGGFEVNEGGIFGRIGLNKVRRPFFNHFRNTP